MSTSELYTVIFQRKSVRKYASAPLEQPALDEIKAFMAGLPSLAPGARAQLRLLGPTQVVRAISAPHYVGAYAETDRLSLLCVGYRLEHLGLWLAQRGLGCCYSGMAAPHTDCAVWEGMPSVIIMAFGDPAEPSRRTGMSAFKRRSLEQICTGDVHKSIAEAVRLAPSAFNNQPWRLRGDKNTLELYFRPRGLRAGLASGMGCIDMGIALAHLEIGARQQGFDCRFAFGQSEKPLGKKDELVCRVHLAG